jgi:DNA-binding SARP family transcriptional activator
MIYVYLFGGLRIKNNNKDINSLGSRKALELFKYLIINSNQKVPLYNIFETFWDGFEEENAKTNLNSTLYFIRKNLKIDKKQLYINFNYCFFDSSKIYIDIKEFETILKKRDFKSLLEAEKIYKGDLLPENANDSWTFSKRDSLKKLYVDTLSSLSDLYCKNQEKEKALNLLNKAFLTDNTRDDIWLKLMSTNLENENFIAAQSLYDEYKEKFKNKDFSMLSNKINMINKKNHSNTAVLNGATVLSEEEFNLIVELEKNKRTIDYCIVMMKFQNIEDINYIFDYMVKNIRKVDIMMKKENNIYILFREIKELESSKKSISEKIHKSLNFFNKKYDLFFI